ncbi:MAG: TatD family hydrolase, partial [Candidatus Bathyarchaeia archaeon]
VKTVSIARQHEGRVFAAIGIHPWTIVQNVQQPVEKFEELIEADKSHVSAIGEIGLDGQYTQDEDKKSHQLEIFKFFLQLAERKKLPVVVHSRLAVEEMLEILPSFNLTRVLMHWYSGPTEKLRIIKDRGYLISIGPSVTYTKRIAEIARTADLATILTETDGPVPYHGPFEGRRTEPFFVVDVVQKLSEIRNEGSETIRDAVRQNFLRFIGQNVHGK